MSPIWQDCRGESRIAALKAAGVRIVESQEQIATTILVDSLDEQHVLEDILESTKPVRPPGAETYHYLIWTPFRYPPLPYGSRFGRRIQPGIFYASLELETALAECAYYRFVFLSGLSVPLPGARLTTEHTTFEVHIATARGVALEAEPFSRHAAAISDPVRYEASQTLGAAMREAGVEAFTYRSARDLRAGTNIGVFTLAAIQSRQPERLRQWICTTTPNAVSFIEVHANGRPYGFPLESFLVEGVLPIPAC